MKHVFKSLNFLGDNDNKITEVCIPAKYALWFSHLCQTVPERDSTIILYGTTGPYGVG